MTMKPQNVINETDCPFFSLIIFIVCGMNNNAFKNKAKPNNNSTK